MTTELEAAPTLIAQTGADELRRQLLHREITPDEYAEAMRYVAPDVEDGPRCLYCTASATIGATCAACASLPAIMNEAREARPLVDLSRCGTPAQLVTAVMATLERSGREKPAGRFAERAEQAVSMNALVQIAGEYVRLVNLLGAKS